jgi:hypothetical protein
MYYTYVDIGVGTLENAIAKDPKNEVLAYTLGVMPVCLCACMHMYILTCFAAEKDPKNERHCSGS